MFYNYYEDYQYDSCVSKGICSVGPRTSSLQEVLIMYLKLLAFYILELQALGGKNKDAEKVILDTISALMFNMESGSSQFEKALIYIKTLLLDSKKAYLKICKEKDVQPKYIQSDIKFEANPDITSLIKEGEHEFTNRMEYLSPERKNLFDIMGFVVKSLCINIEELKGYSDNEELENSGFHKILILLNFLNFPEADSKDILNEIKESARIDYKIFKRLQELKEKYYGMPDNVDVSLSTRPNKAILVAGTCLKELENVLNFTKDKNVDVYTHGEMLLAHTYPRFKEYSNLIGHYGIGIENCLLDFSTFPGAILITKHSIENIEYLYRGRLFTTDYFVPQGVIQIKDNNYSPLLDSALSAKGFKRGKQKGILNVGCSKKCIDKKIGELFDSSNTYDNVIIIGPESYNKKNKIYYQNILKNIPNNVLVISFCRVKEANNIICLNGIIDFASIYYVLEKIKEKITLDISIFISKCDKHTISNIINLQDFGLKNLFLSKCSPIMLNPSLIKTMANYYDISSTENPIDDLNKILSS